MGGSGSKGEEKAKEAAEVAKKAEEEKKAAEAAAVAKKEEEERKAAEAAEASRKAEEERKAAEAVETVRKAEEEKKAAEAAEVARKAEEEKKAAEAAETARKAEEEKKAAEAAEAAKKAEEEKKAAEAAEAAIKAEDKEATKPNADAAVKAEEVKVELASSARSTPSGLAEPDAAGAPASVRRAAALLRRLQPKQRPATAERLQSFLSHRCCRLTFQGDDANPGVLAAALHRGLEGRPKLQDAIKPFVATLSTPDESVAAMPGTKKVLAQLVAMEDAFLSHPLVWRAWWLIHNSKGLGNSRPNPGALLEELRTRGAVVESPVECKEGLRLTYDERKLEAVPEPLQVCQEFNSEEVQAGCLEEAVSKVPSEVFGMPVLAKDVSISLGQGSLLQVNIDKLKNGAKKRMDAAINLKANTRRWVDAALKALPPACSVWSRACIKKDKLVVSVEIAPKPADGEFETALRNIIQSELNLVHDYEVRDLILDSAFWGRQGSNVKLMCQYLGIIMDIDRKKGPDKCVRGSIKFTVKAGTKLTEEEIRRAILLLAGSRSIPISLPIEKGKVKHVVGKGGKNIQMVQASTMTRLRLRDDGCHLDGWPIGALLRVAGPENLLVEFQEKVKGLQAEVEKEIKVILAKAQASHAIAATNMDGTSYSPGAAAKLERTFSNEYRAMKIDRDAKREIERAKKALAASRKQGGGGRWQHKQGGEISRGAVAAVMGLKREVIAGLRSLNEATHIDNTSQEELEEERAELEDSMRELLAEASQAMQQFRESPLKGGSLLDDFRVLLDPDNYKAVSTRNLARGELLEKIRSSTVWQRLDLLAKPRNDHAQKEVLVHVRKGKPVKRATERGGRYKPGEAASASGQSVEEGLAPTAMVPEELLPPEEADEEAAEGVEAAGGAAVTGEADEKKEAPSASQL